MTKKELLEVIKDLPDNARFVVADRDGDEYIPNLATAEPYIIWKHKDRANQYVASQDWWDKWGKNVSHYELVEKIIAIRFA